MRMRWPRGGQLGRVGLPATPLHGCSPPPRPVAGCSPLVTSLLCYSSPLSTGLAVACLLAPLLAVAPHALPIQLQPPALHAPCQSAAPLRTPCPAAALPQLTSNSNCALGLVTQPPSTARRGSITWPQLPGICVTCAGPQQQVVARCSMEPRAFGQLQAVTQGCTPLMGTAGHTDPGPACTGDAQLDGTGIMHAGPELVWLVVPASSAQTLVTARSGPKAHSPVPRQAGLQQHAMAEAMRIPGGWG